MALQAARQPEEEEPSQFRELGEGVYKGTMVKQQCIML